LKFKKVRIGKELILPIILKNEGQVPATAIFDAVINEAFTFEGNMIRPYPKSLSTTSTLSSNQPKQLLISSC
jgi:hydrocephalus-inducing protein